MIVFLLKKRQGTWSNYCPSWRDFKFSSCCNEYNAYRFLTASFGSCIPLIFPMASFTFVSCSTSFKAGLSCFLFQDLNPLIDVCSLSLVSLSLVPLSICNPLNLESQGALLIRGHLLALLEFLFFDTSIATDTLYSKWVQIIRIWNFGFNDQGYCG